MKTEQAILQALAHTFYIPVANIPQELITSLCKQQKTAVVHTENGLRLTSILEKF